jgi:hypothetical protein
MGAKKIIYSTFLVITIVFTACRKEEDTGQKFFNTAANQYGGDKVRKYFNLLCTISKSTPGFFPPQVSRAYGYTGIAAYESVVNGITGAQSLGGQINGLDKASLPQIKTGELYNWSIASNSALAGIIKMMYEKKITAVNINSLDSMEAANLSELSAFDNSEVINRSIQFGKDVAAAIFNYSKTDGGHEAYLDPFQLPFTMQADSFCWVPTGAAVHPLSPYWGNNRPFITANITNTQPADHIPFSSVSGTDFYKEAMDVYNQVRNNTQEQKDITKYWADDPFNTCTPTGHTFNILTQLLKQEGATLEKTTVAYARLGIAENDAFISCWKCKYKYLLIRPVSYIKKYIDPSFTTVIGTPPFPAYISGHSCEMGAGSKVFTSLFTDGSGNYQFTDYSQLQYGYQPRSYTNFNDMAGECAISRFYGGIHYAMDNNIGLEVGRAIGDNVNNLINWPLHVH